MTDVLDRLAALEKWAAQFLPGDQLRADRRLLGPTIVRGERNANDWQVGDYVNHCIECKLSFLGQKRSLVCRKCTQEKDAQHAAPGDDAAVEALASVYDARQTNSANARAAIEEIRGGSVPGIYADPSVFLNKHQAEIADLRAKLESANQAAIRQEDAKSKALAEIAILKADAAYWKHEHETMAKAANEGADEMIKAHHAEIANLKAKLDATAFDDWQHALRECDKLKDTIDSLNAELTATKQEMLNLRTQYEGMVKCEDIVSKDAEKMRQETIRLTADLAKAKRYEGVCHCGTLLSQHNLADGHAAVEMEHPCPFEQELAEAKARKFMVTLPPERKPESGVKDYGYNRAPEDYEAAIVAAGGEVAK